MWRSIQLSTHTEAFPKDSSSRSKTPLTSQQIDEILNDNQISEEKKKPFRDSLIATTKHPFYSKVKGKVPFFFLNLFYSLLKKFFKVINGNGGT